MCPSTFPAAAPLPSSVCPGKLAASYDQKRYGLTPPSLASTFHTIQRCRREVRCLMGAVCAHVYARLCTGVGTYVGGGCGGQPYMHSLGAVCITCRAKSLTGLKFTK